MKNLHIARCALTGNQVYRWCEGEVHSAPLEMKMQYNLFHTAEEIRAALPAFIKRLIAMKVKAETMNMGAPGSWERALYSDAHREVWVMENHLENLLTRI